MPATIPAVILFIFREAPATDAERADQPLDDGDMASAET